jgi:hypothetical protein
MASDIASTPMTTEELLALPEDGKNRWLINGELREDSMTIRNWVHSSVVMLSDGPFATGETGNLNLMVASSVARQAFVCGEIQM